MIAMSAEPFRTTIVNPRFDTREGPMGVVPASLRPAAAPTVFRTALNAAGECGEVISRDRCARVTFSHPDFSLSAAASECKTVAKDFWSRGYNRWIVSRSFSYSSLRRELIRDCRLFQRSAPLTTSRPIRIRISSTSSIALATLSHTKRLEHSHRSRRTSLRRSTGPCRRSERLRVSCAGNGREDGTLTSRAGVPPEKRPGRNDRTHAARR